MYLKLIKYISDSVYKIENIEEQLRIFLNRVLGAEETLVITRSVRK